MMKVSFNNICGFFRNHEKSTLIVLFVITLLLRAVHVAYVYQQNGTAKWGDDWLYLEMGKQIAAGDWTPATIDQPYMIVGPMIPVLIAICYKIFANPILPFFLYNIATTSLIIIVIYYFGKNMFSRNIGWLLAFWGIFNVDHFRYNPHLLKEPTVLLLLPLTLLFLLKASKNTHKTLNLLFSSIAFALLIHSDERYLLYLPIFFLGYLIIDSGELLKKSYFAGLWIGFVFVLMVPWTIRNYHEFKQVVIISPRTTVITSKLWGKQLVNMSFEKKNIETKDRYYNTRIDFEKKYGTVPRKYGKIESYFRAFINYWQPTYFTPTYIQDGLRPQKWSKTHNIFGLFFYGIYLPFYILGIIEFIKNKYKAGIFISLIPIFHSILHTYMIWPLERYRSPMNFIVVMIGLSQIIRLFKISTIKLKK